MKLNDIDLNKMAIFAQIVDAGNYQKASELLNVTPSALSQAVTSLEAALGFSLFDRVGKKMIPTAQGLFLHRELKHYNKGLSQALKKILGTQADMTGTLRIGAYLEFAKSKLTPLLKSFVEEFPAVQVKMVFDTPSRLNAMMVQGQLDLCFSIFPSRERKTISSSPIYEQELVLIAPRGQFSDQPTFQEVIEAPMIDYYLNHTPVREWLKLHYQMKPRKLPIRIYAATAEMVLSLVREGVGIGIVPAYLVHSQAQLAQVKVIRPTQRRLQDHIWLLEKISAEKNPVVAEFKSLVLGYMPIFSTNREPAIGTKLGL